MSSPAPRPAAKGVAIAVAIAILGAALRFGGLTRQSLWFDEVFTALVAQRDLEGCVFAEPIHPPLHSLLVRAAVGALGDTDFAVRLLPALFGCASVGLAWLVGRRLAPRSAPVFALLVATSPFLVYFSQESRSYSLLILLGLASTWALCRVLDQRRGLLLHAALSACLLYTHYFGAFVLLAHEITYWRHGRIQRARWLLARAGVALAFLPWAVWAGQRITAGSPAWVGSPLARAPYALLRYALGHGVAAIDHARRFEPWTAIVREEAPVVLPCMALFGWLLVRGAREVSREPRARTLLSGLLVAPVAILLAASPAIQLLHERYLSFQAPFVLLLVAEGLRSLPPRRRALAAAGWGAVVSFALHAYHAAPGQILGYRLRYAKEPWRDAAAYVEAQRPDAIVIGAGHVGGALHRYLRGPPRPPVLAIWPGSTPDVAGARRVAVVLSHDGPDDERAWKAIAAPRRLIAERVFQGHTGIRVFLYEQEREPEHE